MLGYYFRVSNPIARFAMNTIISFLILSFIYYCYYSNMIEVDLEFDGRLTDENLLHERIKYGAIIYGIYLLFFLWQYNRWIRKPKKLLRAQQQEMNYAVRKETPIKVEKPKRKIDPNKGSFKVSRSILLEKYIRSSD